VRGLALVVAALTAHTAVNARLLRTPTGTRTDRAVSVLLPLRDEAHRVEPCLRALLAQQGVDLEIVVLYDGWLRAIPGCGC